MLREGDTLVVWKLDRLGRSVKHLVDLAGDLENKGIHFRSLNDSVAENLGVFIPTLYRWIPASANP